MRRLVAAAFVVLAAPAARGAPFEAHGFAALRYGYEQNLLRSLLLVDPATRAIDRAGYLQPVDDDHYGQALLRLALDWSPLDPLTFGLVVDTGLVRYGRTVVSENLRPEGPVPLEYLTTRRPHAWRTNGRTFEAEALASGFVRELALTAYLGPNDVVRLGAGKRRFAVLSPFVHDEYATGLALAVDFAALGRRPWRLTLDALLPTRDFISPNWTSPLVALGAEYRLSPIEGVRFGVAFLHERQATLGELLRWSRLEAQLAADATNLTLLATLQREGSGTSNVVWAEVGLSLLAGPVLVEADVVGLVGTARVRAETRLTNLRGGAEAEARLTLASAGLRAAATWPAVPSFALKPFFLFLLGDDPPSTARNQTVTSFFGVAPALADTNLFFSGGISQAFETHVATRAGINGHGVAALGVEGDWNPLTELDVRLSTTLLFASHAAAATGGHCYGGEIDLVVRYEPFAWLGFAVEGDVLVPGDFFARDDPVWQVTLGVDSGF